MIKAQMQHNHQQVDQSEFNFQQKKVTIALFHISIIFHLRKKGFHDGLFWMSFTRRSVMERENCGLQTLIGGFLHIINRLVTSEPNSDFETLLMSSWWFITLFTLFTFYMCLLEASKPLWIKKSLNSYELKLSSKCINREKCRVCLRGK